jgi:lipoprotein-anchoring transpeptidase ErfK/SrfK
MRWRRYPFLLLVVASTLAQQPSGSGGAKFVEIDKTRQILCAFEGRKLVFQSHVSTGRWDGSTPGGTYVAGEKTPMHYSRLYHHAPMPFSVHVTGNVFIHGFTYVPAWPDSHGCIRLPLDGDNPAKRFYDWIEPGTPIRIFGKWRGPPK